MDEKEKFYVLFGILFFSFGQIKKEEGKILTLLAL